MNNKVELGKEYRHYKGKKYVVLCTAIHSETSEEMVVYRALYGENKIYTRPLDMFTGKVCIIKNHAGYTLTANVERFKKI